MIPKRIAAQATALALLVVGLATFLLHAPCRNTNYSDGVFSTLCYTDFAPVFAEGVSSDWNQYAPTTALLGRAVAAIEIGWLSQLIIWQVLLVAIYAAALVAVFRSEFYPRFTASYLLLTPALPFVWFVSDAVIAVSFLVFSLVAWHSGKFVKAGVFAGLALASGMWTWVLLLSYFVIARRFEALGVFRKVAGIAVAVALGFSATRLLFNAPLLVPINFSAGEGTPLFVSDLIQKTDGASNLIPFALGVAILIAVAQYLDYLPLDFRIEPLIVLFISIQLLFSIAISPQHLLHLIWILPLWKFNYKFVLLSSLPLILYTAAVWFRLENGLEGGFGLPDVPYALIAAGLCFYLIWMIWKSHKSITTPGVDRHDQISVA